MQDEAKAPDVALQAILVAPDLGSHVRRCAQGALEGLPGGAAAGDAEVDELHLALLDGGVPVADQDAVRGLDVAVREVVDLVHVVDGADQLPHDERGRALREALLSSYPVLQLPAVAELHAEVQVPRIFEHLVQAHDVWVVEHPQDLHLMLHRSQLRGAPLCHALHRAELARGQVPAALDPAEGAAPQLPLASGFVDASEAAGATGQEEAPIEVLAWAGGSSAWALAGGAARVSAQAPALARATKGIVTRGRWRPEAGVLCG
mmetsp:Transcript_71717/g.214092  ORF Transcript_71717/g.214092 Transcript_71717/m.214092 type:complete len:262 (+) Transcript_71717:957-1742(+)